MKRDPGLDIVRALAIVLVLISHFTPNTNPLGVAGVEIFFVLSGFLIGGIFIKQYLRCENFTWSNLVNFWSRRWYRTLPIYYLFLIVAIFIDSPSGYKQILSYIFFLQNINTPIPEFYSISWSLTIEEWFYLLFPFLVFISTKIWGKSLWSIVGTIITIFVLSNILRIYFTGDNWDATTRKITLGRLDALQVGVLLSVIKHSFHTKWLFLIKMKFVFLIIFAIALIATFNQYSHATTPIHPSLIFLLFPIGSIGVIGIFSGKTLGPLQPIVEFVSKTSYSLYLCHMPVKRLMDHLLENALSDTLPQWVIFKCITLCSILLTSYLLYKYVEMPFMKKRPKESPH